MSLPPYYIVRFLKDTGVIESITKVDNIGLSMIEVHLGSWEESTFVSYRLEQLGYDWVLLITGGKSHIGSVACSEKNRASEEVWQITLGQHKEENIVKNAVLKLKDILSGEILVVGGIHYDNLSRKQIQQIEKNCEALLKHLEEIIIKDDLRNRTYL